MHEDRTQRLDGTDRRLLGLLQGDAQLTAQDLGAALNLSPSQAGRRRQRLEGLGLVAGYTARLSAARLGLSVQAFVQVEMASHDPGLIASFSALVAHSREITSAWTLTGAADHLLRVYCTDLAAFNHLLHKVLLPHPAVARVQSQIVMDQFKDDAPLPI